MKRGILLGTLLTVFSALSISGAGAEVYQPDFKQLDSDWKGGHMEAVKVKDGVLSITPPSGEKEPQMRGTWNQSLEVKDAKLKVKIKLPKSSLPTKTNSGVVIAFKDWENNIEVDFGLSGCFSIYQATAGASKELVPWTQTTALHANSDDWNDVEITTKGSRLTVSVNGAVLKSMPVDGLGSGMFGFTCQCPNGAPGQFKDLQVTYE